MIINIQYSLTVIKLQTKMTYSSHFITFIIYIMWVILLYKLTVINT